MNDTISSPDASPMFYVGSSDYYFAVPKSRPDLMNDINAAMTCTYFTPSLVAVLVPVRNFDKDIRCLTDYLPVPSVFQLDKISFFLSTTFGV